MWILLAHLLGCRHCSKSFICAKWLHSGQHLFLWGGYQHSPFYKEVMKHGKVEFYASSCKSYIYFPRALSFLLKDM